MKKILILMLTLLLTANFVSTSYAADDTLAEKEAKKADKLKKKQEKEVKKAAKKMNIKMVEVWANAGDVQAQMILSYAYQRGLSVSKNLALAKEWKERAEKINPEYVKHFMPSEYFGRRLQLAKLYGIAAYRAQVGYYIKPNYDDAVRWAQLGESEQDTMSLALLGSAYYTGRGVRQDYKAAIEYFKLSQDEPLTLTLLSDAYAKGRGVEKDLKKSKLYADYLSLVRQEKIEKQKAKGEKRQEAAEKFDSRLTLEERKYPFRQAAEKAKKELEADREKIEIEMGKKAAAERTALLAEEVAKLEGKKPATETSEPEKSATETSQPKKPATETSEPEKSATETSEPEKSATETSQPEKPATETSQPKKPATETSQPEKPATETSQPEKEIKAEDLPEVSAPFKDNKKSAEKLPADKKSESTTQQ